MRIVDGGLQHLGAMRQAYGRTKKEAGTHPRSVDTSMHPPHQNMPHLLATRVTARAPLAAAASARVTEVMPPPTTATLLPASSSSARRRRCALRTAVPSLSTKSAAQGGMRGRLSMRDTTRARVRTSAPEPRCSVSPPGSNMKERGGRWVTWQASRNNESGRELNRQPSDSEAVPWYGVGSTRSRVSCRMRWRQGGRAFTTLDRQ